MWLAVLEDLLRVQPPPFPIDIPNMSTDDLKNACVRIARLNDAWTRKGATPHLIREHPVPRSCREMKFLPGGTHVVTLNHDGSIAMLPTGPTTPLSPRASKNSDAPPRRSLRVPCNLDVYGTTPNTALVVTRSAHQEGTLSRGDDENDDVWQLEPLPVLGQQEAIW